MIRSNIIIPQKVYKQLYNHLFEQTDNEQVAFLFAKVFKNDALVSFLIESWYPVQTNEYKYQSAGFVELKDEMRPKIIEKATKLNASIVEIHSHVSQNNAQFSWSDFEGFQEFVPHLWWRLKAKPYAAIVFSRSDFDGLVWIGDPKTPCQLSSIIIKRFFRKQELSPSGLTLKGNERWN